MELKAGQWVKCIFNDEILFDKYLSINAFILKPKVNRYYEIIKITYPTFEPTKLGELYFPSMIGNIWLTIRDEYILDRGNKFCFPILIQKDGTILSKSIFDLENPLDYNPDEVV